MRRSRNPIVHVSAIVLVLGFAVPLILDLTAVYPYQEELLLYKAIGGCTVIAFLLVAWHTIVDAWKRFSGVRLFFIYLSFLLLSVLSVFLYYLFYMVAPWWLTKRSPSRSQQPDQLLLHFDKRRSRAIDRYKRFVMEGVEGGGALEPPERALFYGDDAFIEKTLKRLNLPDDLSERPREQKTMSVQPLASYAARHERDEAIVLAWMSGAYTLRDIGDYFGLHYASISRIVRQTKRDV